MTTFTLFHRLPPSPRPAINGAYQGNGERMFFHHLGSQTSRFRQLADEQLKEKRRRNDVRKTTTYSKKPFARPVFRLLWLVVVALAYFSFSSYRNRRIPFHHALSPRPTLDPAIGRPAFVPTPERQVPPYVHYVFGLHPTFGGKPYNLIYYVCMTSALRILKPEILYLHYVHMPTGFFWDEFVRNVEGTRGGTKLVLRQVRDVTKVFDNPVWHFAHKADVIRLEALKEFGGIYLDVDVLVTRDLAPLYRHETVMGMESQPILDPTLPPSGLCNAVILAKPYAPFITRWLDSYRTFDPNSWAGHSVSLPWQLAQQHPTEITVLNKYAFFWPLHEDHLRLIHRSNDYSFHRPPSGSSSPSALLSGSQFVYHLWESFAYDEYLSQYDPDRIHVRGKLSGDPRDDDGAGDENSFSREARQYVGDALRDRWRKAKRAGLV